MPQTYYEYSNTFLEDDIAYATDIATEFSAIETGLDALWADVPATVQTYVDAATTQATNAAASATAAALSEDMALAASNYAGIWADLVGALNVPASVYHGGGFWMLNSNLADVTLKEPGVDPEWTLIQRPDFTMTASGSITAGDPLILNSNGTVSAVTGTAFAVGSAAVFESANNDYMHGCYDTNNDRVVVVYRDVGNSNYGTACVGTVTGTAISWGTPVVFRSAATVYPKCCFDSTNNKVVIAYADAGGVFGIVGTVSGTTISFGSATTVGSSATSYNLACCFHSGAGKVVVFYIHSDNTTGYTVVGTVSGTAISFGSPVSVSTTIQNSTPRMAYDPDAQRIITLVHNTASPAIMQTFITSVSGTTPANTSLMYLPIPTTQGDNYDVCYDTLNDVFVFVWWDASTNAQYSCWMCTGKWDSNRGQYIFSDPSRLGDVLNFYYPRIVFDSNTNSVILTFYDAKLSYYPVAMTIKASDRELELTDKKNTIVSAAINTYMQPVYDPDSHNIVFLYKRNSDSYGVGIVFTPETSTASEKNFIGFARTSAATTESVIVDGIGNINTSQTGLTTSSMYFVNYDGSLTTSDTGIPAGRALSATSIQVGARLTA